MKARFERLPSGTVKKTIYDNDEKSRFEVKSTASKGWILVAVLAALILILFSIESFSYLIPALFWDYKIISCDIHPAWSSWSTVFEINAPVARVSFATAKLIDLAWDLIVGRGGQIILAWLSYRVFTEALMRITEERPVSYELFASVTLHSGSLQTFFAILPTAIRIKGWRGNMALAWMALATSYVLFFPTLLSARLRMLAQRNQV